MPVTQVEEEPTTTQRGQVLRSSTGISASETGSNLPSEGKNHSTERPRREDSRHQDEEKEDYDNGVTEHGVVVQYPGFPYRDSFPDGTRAQARRLIHECH